MPQMIEADVPATAHCGPGARRPRARPAGAGPAPQPVTAPSDKAKEDCGTKADMLIALLRRAEGATIAQMCAATGWLPHSVRGFMAGTLRKRYGIAVVSEKTDADRVYRVTVDGANA